jgi:hypothetical protein
MWKLLRKPFILVVSTAMMVGGLYLLVAELFLAHRIFARIMIAGATLTAMGATCFGRTSLRPWSAPRERANASCVFDDGLNSIRVRAALSPKTAIKKTYGHQ